MDRKILNTRKYLNGLKEIILNLDDKTSKGYKNYSKPCQIFLQRDINDFNRISLLYNILDNFDVRLTEIEKIIKKGKEKDRKKDRIEDRKYGIGVNYHGKKWSEKEYEILKDMISKKKSLNEMSEYLGRTEYSIECKLSSLDLIMVDVDNIGKVYYRVNPEPNPELSKKNRLQSIWTLSEYQKLYDLYMEELDFMDISVKLNRSVYDLQEKLEKMGLIEIIEQDIEM